MKYLAILTLAIAGCGAGPLVTEGELIETIAASDARQDEGAQRVVDLILATMRALFPERAAEIPALAIDMPAPTAIYKAPDASGDWSTTLQVAIGSISAALAAYLGIMVKRGPATKNENVVKDAQAKSSGTVA